MKLNKIYTFLLFFILCFPLIKSTGECDGCNSNSVTKCLGDSCNANCRPKFSYGSITCYLCNFAGENFYQITADDQCVPKTSCDASEKIVHGSNECVSSCDSNSYKMGDYCYHDAPPGSSCDASKECTCQYKYYITNDNKQEYHCLVENEECPSRYNYYDADTNQCSLTVIPSKKIKIEYRANQQPIYRCSNDCSGNEILTSDGNYCIDNCPQLSNKKFYYPNENDEKTAKCVSDCSTYNLRELNNKCVSSCESPYYLNGNECIGSCSSGFYKLVGTEKVCVAQADSANCLYSQSESESIIKRCYSSCLEIGTDYIYQKGNICNNVECDYHSTENTVKICYENKQECQDNHYLYLQGKKCLKECNGFIYEDTADNILKYCYATVDDCILNNLNYYTLSPKKCYSSSCPGGLYPKYPVENNRNLCIDCTNLKISNNFCKESCDNTECYFIDNEAINSNVCNSISDYFYYIDEISNKKICVNDCKSKGKFFFSGSKECLQECKKTISGVEKKFYYDPADNSCLEQCPSGLKYLVENTYKCLSECPEQYPYDLKDANYNTNGHLICKRFHPCSGNNYLILDGQCASPQDCGASTKKRINSKNICEASCEDDYDYIEKVVDGVFKCLQNCYKYIINTNECVDKCPSGNNYIGANNVCKPNCDNDGNKFYLFSEEDGYKIYKCASSCPTGYLLTKFDNSDNQCYSKCPQSHKYLLSSENKCYNSCKNVVSYPFSLTYTENNEEKHICATSCNSANPNFEETDKECKSGCNIGNNRVIDHDGKCVQQCDQTSTYKYNLDGKCVNKCPENKKRYYKDGNNQYICVDNCLAHGNYILNDECVAQGSCSNTQYFYNPVKKNGIETGEYECKINCPNGFFKTDTNSDKKCLEQCITTDYALIDTKECVSDCNKQIPGDPTKTYHTYKPGTTYTINTCVKECPEDKPYLNDNECVNSCPNYIEDNKCVPTCSTHDYYIGQILPNDRETLNICRDDCPLKYPYYIVDPQNSNKYICSYECPNELKFHKNDNPSIIGMKCNNDCPDATYKFLSDDEKECLKKCPSGKYYINAEGQKCHNACPEEKPYLSRNDYECLSMENCPNKFVDYSNKLCIDSCSGFKYKYEKRVFK